LDTMCFFIYGKSCKEMNIVPHSLRGTMATYWASLGVPMMVIRIRGDWLKEETVFKYYINSRYFEEILDSSQTSTILGETLESEVVPENTLSNVEHVQENTEYLYNNNGGILFREQQENLNILFSEKIEQMGFKFSKFEENFLQTTKKIDQVMNMVSSMQEEMKKKTDVIVSTPKPLPNAQSQSPFNYKPKPAIPVQGRNITTSSTIKSSLFSTQASGKMDPINHQPNYKPKPAIPVQGRNTTTSSTIKSSIPSTSFPNNAHTIQNSTNNFFNKKQESMSISVSNSNSQCQLHKEPVDFCIFCSFS